MPQHRLAAARSTLDGIVDGLIARRRTAALDTGDVASALLAARGDGDAAVGDAALDDTEVRDQLMTLLAAGHATTAVALSWALYLLAHHPQVAATLHDELSRVLVGRAPTAEDLDNLPYLDQVFCETLRLYPPAWAIGRLAHADVAVAGYTLPAGTLLMLSPWVTQRLPDLFPYPGAFCPERFAPAARATIPPHAYFPFGAGARMCIGAAFATLEAKVVLAMILQRFTLTMADDRPVLPRAAVILRPAGPIRMRIGS
jgi:cytochrome P450